MKVRDVFNPDGNQRREAVEMKGIYCANEPMMDRVRVIQKDHPITAYYFTNLYANMERELPFPETTDQTAWQQWRSALRKRLVCLMSIDSWGALDSVPAYEVLEESDHERYVRRKITFETLPGNYMLAYLLIPKGLSSPVPAVLCPHGHFQQASLSTVEPSLAGGVAYAHELAERGFVALAPENAGNGERDVPAEEVYGQMCGGCDLLFRRLNHLGRDLTGFRIYELILCLNLLCSLSEVDSRRIGGAGLSGGCWLTQVLAALDERVKAVILSGYFTTFAQTACNGHCICHHPKGIGSVCDMTDLSALIAPRYQYVESGSEDSFYPPEPAFSIVKRAYSLLGSSENFDIDLFQGGHMFRGTKSIPWLADVLNDRLA